MSQLAYEAVEKARSEALNNQTKCSWCDKICKNSNHLVAHILLRHKS